MKLTFQKDDLLNSINIVLKAVPSKTTMPILECILIDASDNQIKLTANDMELGIDTKVEGSILSKGKIALDAKLLSEIIRKLSGGESDITIESDDKYNTTITCDNSVFHIQGKNGDEFSYLPFIEKDHFICLSQFTLKEVIRQTLFSISVNDSNKMMTGELFQVTDCYLCRYFRNHLKMQKILFLFEFFHPTHNAQEKHIRCYIPPLQRHLLPMPGRCYSRSDINPH